MQHGGGVFGMPAPILKQFSEGVFRNKLHVLGKHGEQGAHQETGHGIGRMALRLEGLAKLGRERSS